MRLICSKGLIFCSVIARFLLLAVLLFAELFNKESKATELGPSQTFCYSKVSVICGVVIARFDCSTIPQSMIMALVSAGSCFSFTGCSSQLITWYTLNQQILQIIIRTEKWKQFLKEIFSHKKYKDLNWNWIKIIKINKQIP